MVKASFARANEIYKASAMAEVFYREIDYPELKEYSLKLKEFQKALGESSSDDLWASLLRRLRSIIYILSGSPLETELLLEQVLSTTSLLEEQSDKVAALYPPFSRDFKSLVGLASHLQTTNLQIVRNEVLAVASQHTGQMSLIIRRADHLKDVAQSFARLRNLEVTSADHLVQSDPCETLLVIGPPAWFPEWIFTAPRASRTHVIKYKWMGKRFKYPQIFIAPVLTKAALPPLEEVEDEVVEPDLALPTINLSRVMEKFGTATQANESDAEFVNAFLCQLGEDEFVFIDSDEATSVHVINVDAGTTVQKIPVSQLDVGAYLLLRTSGAGDFIVPLADRIMRGDASEARINQRLWKDILRKLVGAEGLAAVLAELKEHGSIRASTTNLRNWMSYRSIKTNDQGDFYAIMKLVGLEDRADEIWRQMELINSAHIRAGHHLRKILLEEVQKVDLRELTKTGKMNFALPDEDAGAITAYRLTAISSPDTTLISPSRLGVPFNLDQPEFDEKSVLDSLFGFD